MLNVGSLFLAQIAALPQAVESAQQTREREAARVARQVRLAADNNAMRKRGKVGRAKGVQVAKARAVDTQDRMVEAIRTAGPLRPIEVSNESGVCIESVRLHLRAIEKARRIVNVGSRTRPVWGAA